MAWLSTCRMTSSNLRNFLSGSPTPSSPSPQSTMGRCLSERIFPTQHPSRFAPCTSTSSTSPTEAVIRSAIVRGSVSFQSMKSLSQWREIFIRMQHTPALRCGAGGLWVSWFSSPHPLHLRNTIHDYHGRGVHFSSVCSPLLHEERFQQLRPGILRPLGRLHPPAARRCCLRHGRLLHALRQRRRHVRHFGRLARPPFVRRFPAHPACLHERVLLRAQEVGRRIHSESLPNITPPSVEFGVRGEVA